VIGILVTGHWSLVTGGWWLEGWKAGRLEGWWLVAGRLEGWLLEGWLL
jgi:hypothetical protein